MTAMPRGAQAGETMGRLTTHILDTAQGCPASNVGIRVFFVAGERTLVTSATSNADGRTEQPLLEGDAMRDGCYELEFDIGDYFASQGVRTGEPAFLDTVVIRFSIAASEHYHVPLLASPWSYSTYRGS
jgi:5-hydroxyisourate hydrolase